MLQKIKKYFTAYFKVVEIMKAHGRVAKKGPKYLYKNIGKDIVKFIGG